MTLKRMDYVSSPVDQDGLDTEKLATDIDSISIKDELQNGTDSDKNSGDKWKGTLPNGATSKRQESVGSLSFNVIDTSSSKQSKESVNRLPSENVRKAVKPAPRAKVPFEKGYSQMDWLKLTRTHPDLAGLNGQSNKRLISLNEVKQHQYEGSMWTVLKGRVYNLYPYMRFHPGGFDILKKAVGKDCTSLFNKYHAWVNAEFLLEKCLIGTLDESEGQQHSKDKK
ncbi:hypothetical protein FEM48_Zijuj05G0013000 [Ziziphus jujuba var. spinosa]|uniref:Cytochrome b5 heme-binding domain-containing protein n=1 Tax=Ziziphus jujuba var. spinosa TaxID=714518 RepID=A0A978VBY7_ZIZJJ|nr:hypothetical protein FEM48_Zijuj05G0013000 [Ziziphus jujuba var. spinosa]